MAFVTVRPDTPVDDQQLTAFVRSRLAGFEVPEKFVYGELPKTSTGKVQRSVLRDQCAGDRSAHNPRSLSPG